MLNGNILLNWGPVAATAAAAADAPPAEELQAAAGHQEGHDARRLGVWREQQWSLRVISAHSALHGTLRLLLRHADLGRADDGHGELQLHH